MNFSTWSTITLATWAALGPLVGVFLGQYLADRYQKDRWIADSQKKEWKELMGAIDQAFEQITEAQNDSVYTRDEQIEAAKGKASLLFLDRIFIADEVVNNDLQEKFNVIVEDVSPLWDLEKLKDARMKFRREILNLARKDVAKRQY
jgi:hypothetical protein